MATAGKSNKKKGEAKPKRKLSAADPRRDALVDAKLGDGRTSVEAQESPRPTIRELAIEFLKHPDEWLDHPNPQFGGRTPNELIAAGEEEKLYNLFFCYEHGMF